MPRESAFQGSLIHDIKNLLPDSIVMKLDANYIQGIPDLLVLNGHKWGVLECKRSANAPRRPNQDYYISRLDEMSFARIVCPENKEMVLREIQQALRC